ncbi:MAG TPA: hypothetical protein VK056_00940 [Bacillota bacterium]|nr:hypothetical protein [Bacillota bacterium]
MPRIIIAFFLMLLIACSPTDSSKNADAIITETEVLNEQILSILSDRIFIYDLEIKDKSIEEVHVSLNYYKDGELVGDIQQFSMPIDEVNDLTIAYVQQIFKDISERWVLAIFDEKGFGSGEFENDWPKERKEDLGAVWGNVSMPLYLTKGEKAIVGYISYSGKDVISSPVAIETEEQLQQLVDDDFVYVLWVEVK